MGMVSDKGFQAYEEHLTKGLLEYSHSAFLVLAGIGEPVIHIIQEPALSLIVRKNFRELTGAMSPTPAMLIRGMFI